MFCEPDDRPEEILIVLANMHGSIGRPPEAHIYFDHRADWMEVSDDLPRLGGESGVEPLRPPDDSEPDRL